MHAANFMKTVPQLPVSNHFTESDAEDIKIDVESDEGEIEVSPSPSTGDITENESSSSSTGPMISPNCGDGDCGELLSYTFFKISINLQLFSPGETVHMHAQQLRQTVRQQVPP